MSRGDSKATAERFFATRREDDERPKEDAPRASSVIGAGTGRGRSLENYSGVFFEGGGGNYKSLLGSRIVTQDKSVIENDTPVIYLRALMGEVFKGPGYRTCAHAGCKWPAIATLGFDYEARRAWIHDLDGAEEPSTYDLCSVHAGRFRAPRGWESQDLRRVPEPLFAPPDLKDDSAGDGASALSPKAPAEKAVGQSALPEV